MENPVYINDNQIDTDPAIDVASLHPQLSTPGWDISQLPQDPVITIKLTNENIPNAPIVERVVIITEHKMINVTIEGKRPDSLEYEELVTGPIAEDGSQYLPGMTKLTNIRVTVKKPENPMITFTIKMSVFACFEPTGEFIPDPTGLSIYLYGLTLVLTGYMIGKPERHRLLNNRSRHMGNGTFRIISLVDKRLREDHQ